MSLTLRGSSVKSRRILEMERGAGRADKMNLFEVAGLSWEEGKGMMGKKSQSDAWRYLKHDEER